MGVLLLNYQKQVSLIDCIHVLNWAINLKPHTQTLSCERVEPTHYVYE